MTEEKKTYEELEARVRELEDRLKEHGNREYKSRLFSFLFGRSENRRWTLSLYNALHGTSHDNPSVITVNTIEDVVYMGMKNDLSFLVSETVSLYRSMELYEQQSSFNPNMPVRELMYAGKLYDKFIHAGKLNRYGRTLVPLPLPKLVVFYNGEDEKEDESVLRLSDAFKEEIRRNLAHRHGKNPDKPDDAADPDAVEKIFRKASPDIEVKVRMLNINHGHNRKLLSACRPLGEYAWFVAQVRKSSLAGKNSAADKDMGIAQAIDRAIDEMPEHFEIKKFITANRAEVKDMCLTEYDEAETMELLRQEEQLETRLIDIRNLMDCTGWTAQKAMDSLKIPLNQRASLYAGLSKTI